MGFLKPIKSNNKKRTIKLCYCLRRLLFVCSKTPPRRCFLFLLSGRQLAALRPVADPRQPKLEMKTLFSVFGRLAAASPFSFSSDIYVRLQAWPSQYCLKQDRAQTAKAQSKITIFHIQTLSCENKPIQCSYWFLHSTPATLQLYGFSIGPTAQAKITFYTDCNYLIIDRT